MDSVNAFILSYQLWHTFQQWDEHPSVDWRACAYEDAAAAVAGYVGTSATAVRIQVTEWRKLYLPPNRQRRKVKT